MIRFFSALCIAVLTTQPAFAQERFETGQSSTRPVFFSESDFKKTRIGKLEFLSGLEWSSDRADFGGFSGMVLGEDQETMIALTDKAHWVRATLIFNPQGHLAAIKGLDVWRLYGADGAFLQRPFTDSEAITRDGDDLLISFERKHRVSRFKGLNGREQAVAGLPDFSGLSNNRGLESLLKLPDGRLVMIAEEPPSEADGNDHVGWVLDDGAIKRFSIRREGSYSPTDITLGPDGETLYLLERRFSWIGGAGMRIRQFPVAALNADETIKGEALIDVGSGYAVDNMEALATRRGANGETELLVLSDDNFSNLQRTLLLHFRVLSE